MSVKSPIAKKYEKFVLALASTKPKPSSDISMQIFYDLFRIRDAQWKYKVSFNREVDSSVSDIFQDLLGHYLNICLPKKYEVLLEHYQNKLRPDILIKKGSKNWAIIEVKTTIGWNRDLVRGDGYLKRLKELSREFKVPLKRVFYIFESSRNVSNDFAEQFDINRRAKINLYILPLFSTSASPYYLSKRLNRSDYKNFSNKQVLDIYKQNKLTDFKDIIKKITTG